jgi:uncharacterized protein YyaL (SSP411 family)
VTLLWLLACASGGGPPPADAVPPEPPSALARETSPYLREHAADLVAWSPWGPAPFRAAAERDLPLLVVIGYSTCHWCHVLAEESFRDAEIAGLVNDRFVPVLVDREERPDVDAAQLRAAQVLTGKALGWPLVLVVSPDGELLFASTYLPARDGDRGSKVGLATVLGDLAERWVSDRGALLDRGRALAQDLAGGGAIGGGPLPPSLWREVDTTLAGRADPVNGGFGKSGPRFPRPTTLDAWSAWSVRHDAPAGRDHAALTLRVVARSALHDPLDGGFHRYATDAAWTEVHYEKTLTDNAQLGRAYLDARRASPEPLFDDAARDVARFLGGMWAGAGLASAIDADSVGPGGVREEGAYYVLSRAELAAALGEADGAAAADALGLPATGAGAPRLAGPLSEAGRQAAVLIRAARSAPPRDDKVVLGWQGLALGFLARAGRELPDALAAKLARRLSHTVLTELDAGAPSRTVGGASPALLDDLAFAAEGLLEQFLATQDPACLAGARRAVALADERFARPEGGHWRSAATDPPLPVRPTADEDGSEPPAAAILARTRLRLAALTGDDAMRDRVATDLLATSGAILARPASHTTWLSVADALTRPPPEVVVVVPAGTDGSALTAALWSTPAPLAVELVTTPEGARALSAVAPWLEGKDDVEQPTTYVCTRGVCQAPATTPDAVKAALAAAR